MFSLPLISKSVMAISESAESVSAATTAAASQAGSIWLHSCSFVATSEEAHSVLEEYEIRTTSRFSCYVAQKGFGNTDICE